MIGVSLVSVNRWENGQSRPNRGTWQHIYDLENSLITQPGGVPAAASSGALETSRAEEGRLVLPSSSGPLTRLAFSVHQNPRVYALLIGSGVSRAAKIPTAWEIMGDLVMQVIKVEEGEGREDWDVRYEERTGKKPNYSDVISELGLSPHERRSILEKYIEPSDEDRMHGRKAPTAAHRAIARLVRDQYNHHN